MPYTLHVLLIGIDQYAHVRPLTGCEQDVQRMAQYLNSIQHQMPWELEMHQLLNRAANRAGILSAFENRLYHKVQPDDLVLIYYSGHGAQEEAGEVWHKSEYDGRLEGWVAQDTGVEAAHARLIADKELRYWLGKIGTKGARIISISDCCHSHDNHRSSQPVPPAAGQDVARRSELVLPERPFEDFCFAGEISAQDLATRSIEELLPTPRMVVLSACEAWELAYESTDVGGIFTHYLLDILRESGGETSYFELQSQVAQRIRRDRPDYPQRPRAAISFGHEPDLFEYFLQPGQKGRSRILANLTPLPDRNTPDQHFWQMDKGQIHGVKASGPDLADSLVAISLSGEKVAYGYVIEVETASSVVMIPSTDLAFQELEESASYRGYLPGLMQRALRLHLHGEAELVQQTQAMLEESGSDLEKAGLIFQTETEGADFGVKALTVQGDVYLIVTELGNPRPLLRQIFCGRRVNEEILPDLVSQLRTLQTWAFARYLHNDRPEALDPHFISLEILKSGQVEPQIDDVITVELDGVERENLQAEVEIRLRNDSSQSLYVSLLFLDANGAISSGLLRPSVARLDAGGKIIALEGRSIKLKLYRHCWQFNHEVSWFFLQVVFSTEPFTVEEYDQQGAPWPQLPWDNYRNPGVGLDFGQYEDEEPTGTWQARCYRIVTSNPYFDPSGEYTS